MSWSRTRLPHHRARLAAALTTGALVLVPAAAAHADGWLPGPDFGIGTENSSVDLAETPDGSTNVVWVDGPTQHVMFRHGSPADVLGPAQAIGNADIDTFGDGKPVIAVGASGAGAVVWAAPAGDSGNRPIEIQQFSADGTLGRQQSVGSVNDIGNTSVGVDAAGDATVVWDGTASGNDVVQAVRVAADGTPGAPAFSGGNAIEGLASTVAVAPGGTAWVAWSADGGSTAVTVARLNPAGTLDGTATIAPSANSPVELAASDAGAVAAWDTQSSSDNTMVNQRAVRLPASGGIAGATLALPDELEGIPAFPSPAIGPDGTVSIAYTDISAASGGIPSGSEQLARFAGAATTATPVTLSAPSSTSVPFLGGLASAPNGTLLASWILLPLAGPGSVTSLDVQARRIAPDGSLGALATPGQIAIVGVSFDITNLPVPQVDDVGGGLLGIRTETEPDSVGLVLRRLDAAGPAVTANVPATAVTGTPIALSATASDASGVSAYAWDFGDGTQSNQAAIQHTYGAAGTYTVTLTVTDGLGNATTVTKPVTVTTPVGSPPPPSPPPVKTAVKKVPAALKVGKATRTGAKVTVSGTIAKAAGGKVTIAYAEKIGRKTVTKKVTTAIKQARWSVSFKLTGKLATKAALRGKANVTVSYAGDSDTAKASSPKHAVSVVKPKPAKKKKPAAHKRHR